jgi:hypothetical protein
MIVLLTENQHESVGFLFKLVLNLDSHAIRKPFQPTATA